MKHVLPRIAAAALCGLLSGAATAAEPGTLPLRMTPEGEGRAAVGGGRFRAKLPAENNLHLTLPSPRDWTELQAMEFGVQWPADAPTNAQVLVFLKDWDHFWYQTLLPGYLKPGSRTDFAVDLRPEASAKWEATGHFGVWHYGALHKPKLVGLRIFGGARFEGAFAITNAVGVVRRDDAPPVLRGVRANSQEVPCFGKFELTFAVPDRYVDPFDPQQVAVSAEFRTPGGATVPVDGFYGRDFYRQLEPTGERLVPQGRPYWRVRFSPLTPGPHTYTLKVRDSRGTAEWGPGAFVATPAREHGFLRVAKSDPRYFEFSDGAPFFPIGHNIRSPNDTRVEKNFPWLFRWPEGSASYLRRFADMGANGENFAEIWSASWSLGLEWNAEWPGYRGVGQYNMMHAWEFDRTIDEAELQGIYIGHVIHNHGKFSAFSDEEWASNPFNRANGGYLNSPDEYFSDPRALASFRKLMRYMVSRWAYSTHLASWQLWSELDLTGSVRDTWRRPEVVDWHRLMGQEIKNMDPYDHLVSTHVCGDYTHQAPEIISLPQIDFCAVDAYHNESNPLHIVELVKATVNFNNPYGKPVLVTEFGGTPMAQGLQHLVHSLHAALWTSTSTPVAGTPLFWWWHLIEEERLYPMFGAVSRFMAGEDRRDPKAVMGLPALSAADGRGGEYAGVYLANGSSALGWVYKQAGFELVDPRTGPSTTNLVVRLSPFDAGAYRVEYWNTSAGEAFDEAECRAAAGGLEFAVPPFNRDFAFKVKPARAR